MIIRYSLQYLFVRGASALLSVVSLIAYVNLMPIAEFGRYMLTLSAGGLLQIVFFQWVNLAALRLLPASRHPDLVLPKLRQMQYRSAMLLVLLVLLVQLGLRSEWRDQALMAMVIAVTGALLQLELSALSSRFAIWRYGFISVVKSAVALIVGIGFLYNDMGFIAPALGLVVGTVVALFLARQVDRGSLRDVNGDSLDIDWRACMYYGMPMSMALAMIWVVDYADRFLVALFMGEAQAGVYSAAYDLCQQTQVMILSAISAAIYPGIVRAFSSGSFTEASDLLIRNRRIVCMAASAVAAAMIVAADFLSSILGYEGDALFSQLIVLTAVSSALFVVRVFHVEIAFQLYHRTGLIALNSFLAAVLNVVLNIALIPEFGLLGASFATLAAMIFSLLLSLFFKVKVFGLRSLDS